MDGQNIRKVEDEEWGVSQQARAAAVSAQPVNMRCPIKRDNPAMKANARSAGYS